MDELLDAGISVITSINIQYIDELRERVQQITGKNVTQTVPRSFLNSADEIVVVDAPPEMCMHTDRYGAGLQCGSKSFRSCVNCLTAGRRCGGPTTGSLSAAQRHTQTFGAQERILVCITPRANAAPMIASGKRNPTGFMATLPSLMSASQKYPPTIKRRWNVISRSRGKPKPASGTLDGEDPIDTLLDFARERGITQIFVGHSASEKWWERFTGTPLDRLIRGANDIDVRVFPHYPCQIVRRSPED